MLKNRLCIFLAIMVVCAVWFVSSEPLLFALDGKRSYYVGSSSSCALCTDNEVDLRVFTDKYGESVYLDREKNCEEIFSLVGAELVFVEEINEGISYYGYSTALPYKKTVNGDVVNVHVFIGEGYTVVGTPIIYGGY